MSQRSSTTHANSLWLALPPARSPYDLRYWWPQMAWPLVAAVGVIMLTAAPGPGSDAQTGSGATLWRDEVVAVREETVIDATRPQLILMRQDFEKLEINKSVIATPLRIGERDFTRGLGTHSVGHLRVVSDDPIVSFAAWVGVDHNVRTESGIGSIAFVVATQDKELQRTEIMRGGEAAQRIELALEGTKSWTCSSRTVRTVQRVTTRIGRRRRSPHRAANNCGSMNCHW